MAFLDLFAKSPFKPLQEHMHMVLECARQVPPLVEALCRGDLESVRSLERRIDELEGEADKLKNDLRAPPAASPACYRSTVATCSRSSTSRTP